MSRIKICLTIAGLDPSGGAGVIADIKTFSAFGCFATAAISSITFQNTTGVFGTVHQTAETVRGQVEPIIRDYTVDAVKTGMLPTREVIEETARLISRNGLQNIVVDPVVRSTSGFDLIDDGALRSLIELLFPLSDVVTPNLPEAERISGIKITTESDIEKAAKIMQAMGAKNVLIKGGHPPLSDLKFEKSDSNEYADVDQSEGLKIGQRLKARDFLFIGSNIYVFEDDFIATTATHGTGCTLSSAIAANLALGNDLKESLRLSKKFVTNAIRTAPGLGHGNSPINI
ncbi:MAG: hydroxymethylpyrimidine/phosphomethylpyrimidine kinase [Saprospiraceae bacterium]|nr:hydroxymethylpyrimidine/phosphomethylpyrimidine kinase [Pyrinomonadaceae bacterium]